MLVCEGIRTPFSLRVCQPATARRIAPMAIRIASQTVPCKGDSAIRFTTYPSMRWTSSRSAKKPEAISDSYCSTVMR